MSIRARVSHRRGFTLIEVMIATLILAMLVFALYRFISATLRALAANGQPALEESAGGVSDGSWTSHVGVPTVDGLGPVGGDDHTEREWIELASVGPRVDAIVALCES